MSLPHTWHLKSSCARLEKPVVAAASNREISLFPAQIQNFPIVPQSRSTDNSSHRGCGGASVVHRPFVACGDPGGKVI